MRLGFCMLISCIFIVTNVAQCTHVHHRVIKPADYKSSTLMWTNKDATPFTEMIVSWSGQRPESGSFLFEIAVRNHTEWSSWFDYAVWGTLEQHLFNLQAYKDIDNFLKGAHATGFRVRATAREGASLQSLRALHAATTDLSKHQLSSDLPALSSRILDVQRISQIAPNHIDSTRICSPTSTASAVAFLLNIPVVDPLDFAVAVRESFSRIYGAWALNTAQAAHALGALWYCYVARCSHLSQIIKQLNKGHPVVVSIQGPISGGARPYEGGHLIVIRGYDAEQKKVLCMDPAFPTDDTTYVSYHVDDFLHAWKRRKGMAYIFTQQLPHE